MIWIQMCGVSIKIGGKTAAIWIVIGIMEREDGCDVPSYVMRTTPERYDKSTGISGDACPSRCSL